MKRFLLVFIIVGLLSGIQKIFGQDEIRTISVGVASPLIFVEPDYTDLVGTFENEKWNVGFTAEFDFFSQIGTKDNSKFLLGGKIAYSKWTLFSMDIHLTEYAQFKYYGVEYIVDNKMTTDATLSGGTCKGDMSVFEISPGLRYKIGEQQKLFLQSGIDFYIYSREIIPQINNFEEDGYSFSESELGLGVYLGIGYKIKFIEIQPSYQIMLTNGKFHYGSLKVGFAF